MCLISAPLLGVNDFLDEPLACNINLIEKHKTDTTDLLEDRGILPPRGHFAEEREDLPV